MKYTNKKKPLSTPFYIKAQKNLGQNFLINKDIIENIIKYIEKIYAEKKSNLIIEIGPGSGALTAPLLEKNFSLLLIEKDSRAVKGIKETFTDKYQKQFEILEIDILDFNLTEYFLKNEKVISEIRPLCIGNLPYYITSDILEWFSKNILVFGAGIFMLQLEVVDRLASKPSSKSYGRLSVKFQLLFDVKKIIDVSAECFVPVPKVNSAIVSLVPKNISVFESKNVEEKFDNFMKKLFSARRKMIRKTLIDEIEKLNQLNLIDDFNELLNAENINLEQRPDSISPTQFLSLFNFFNKNIK